MNRVRTFTVAIAFISQTLSLSACCRTQMMAGPIAPEFNRPPAVIRAPTISCPGRTEEECLKLEQMIRRTTTSTVWIQVTRYDRKLGVQWGYGSGAVIDRRGTVLTAQHVIRDAVQVTATFRQLSADGRLIDRLRTVRMRIAAQDSALDCALLEPLDGEEMPPPLPWLPGRPEARQQVFGFGHSSSWSEGRVLSPVANMQIGSTIVRGLIRVESTTRRGDSGGPLVSRSGRVLGILVLHKPQRRWSYYRPIDQALRALGYEAP